MKGKLILRRPTSRVQVAIDAATASNDCGVLRLVWYDEGSAGGASLHQKAHHFASFVQRQAETIYLIGL